MNIKQVARLLNDIGVETIATDTSLGPDVDFGVNYYKLMLNKSNNKWEFLFVPHEKRSSGGEKIKKSFDDKVEAIKYYNLLQLYSHYLNHYIHPFDFNHMDLNL